MININSLMLGDLVSVDGKICKVIELGGMACVTPVDYEDGLFCNDEDIEPIPLTPEILEKNGFEKDPESGELIWTDNDVTEVVWVGTILTIHGEDADAEFAICMFTHQLQHALRLCGIDKEIVL